MSTMSTSGLRGHSTCAVPLAARKSRTMRQRCSLPGVSTSKPPRLAASRRMRQRRTRRCTPCGGCSGSGALTVRCGLTGPWCRMSRQEPERRCARRMVGVKR
ncbi:hypothetical protein TRVL_08024 [Trypanosoma vivax]|nr:hypothetical protein TRVL_08024 [Trypanosoma vivax]